MTTQPDAPNVMLHSGLLATLDRVNPVASAVVVRNGMFAAVGRREDGERSSGRPK
jgi:predicted amidohydrolase YtcJ